MPPQYWVGVAFLPGDFHRTGDWFIMETTGGPFVHSELLLGVDSYCMAFSSYGDAGGFVPSLNKICSSHWVIVRIPVAPEVYARAVQTCRDVLAVNPTYNSSDLWQCCIQLMLPYEKDVDCQNPRSWKSGVFCSQVCLLFLRKMAREGAFYGLTGLAKRLESMNSRGCSPSQLYDIMAKNWTYF